MNLYQKIKLSGSLIHLFGLLIILLAGCAVTPDNWAFTREVVQTDKLDHVKRIALLDVPPPSKIQLGPAVDEGALFWLGGAGLFVEGEGSTVTTGPQIAETTRNELKDWLEKAGKEVILIEVERSKQSKMLKDYSQFAQVNADAILEIAPINIGFVDELGKIEFCAFPPCDDSKRELSPDVTYKYRLVSVKSQEVLIQSNVSYSSFPGQYSIATGTNLTGPKEHIFKNSDTLKQQPEEAVRRLKHAIKDATKIISKIITNQQVTLSDKLGIPIESVNFTGNFSGTYISSLTANHYIQGNWRRYLNVSSEPTVNLVQEGNKISGTFGNSGKIWGEIDGNTITFEMRATPLHAPRGKWHFEEGSSEVVGKWSYGDWNLIKIE